MIVFSAIQTLECPNTDKVVDPDSGTTALRRIR